MSGPCEVKNVCQLLNLCSLSLHLSVFIFLDFFGRKKLLRIQLISSRWPFLITSCLGFCFKKMNPLSATLSICFTDGSPCSDENQ